MQQPDKIAQLFQKNENDLTKIAIQRRKWLYASSIVWVAVIIIIFGWDWMTSTHQKSLWWIFISSTLIVCVNWWYWTMKNIYDILNHQATEYILIMELLHHIKEVRKEIYILENCKCVDDDE